MIEPEVRTFNDSPSSCDRPWLREAMRDRCWLAMALLGAISSLVATGCIVLKPGGKDDVAVDASGTVGDSRGAEDALPTETEAANTPADVATDSFSLDDRAANADVVTYDAEVPISDVVDAGDDRSVDGAWTSSDGESDVSRTDGDVLADGAIDAQRADDSSVSDVGVDQAPGAGDACVANCSKLGDFRCEFVPGPGDVAVPRKVEVCSLAHGCLEWLDTGTCNEDEICCAGACRGRGSPSSCEADIYVDAKNGVDELDAGLDGGGGDASPHGRPFRTITFAIERAKAWPGKRIHVAPGLYDVALGERFPLMLRNGTSLIGTDPNLVTVEGSGAYDHTSAGGSYPNASQVTVVIGDNTFPTTISGLTLRGDQATPTADKNGIVCDRGSGPAQSDNDVAGVTILDNLVVASGYWGSVVAANSVAPARSGCNLRMTRCAMSGGKWGWSPWATIGYSPTRFWSRFRLEARPTGTPSRRSSGRTTMEAVF